MKNRFRKKMKIKYQVDNIIKQYPNLEIIEFDKIFDTNLKIDRNNKIKKLIFFDNKELQIEKIDGYNLSNIEIGFDKLLIIGYESEDYIIEKSYTLDIADKEILYWHDIDTITIKKVKDEWIKNDTIVIPSYNIVKNIELGNLDGTNSMTLDLRNINKIEKLKISNTANINSLILNTGQLVVIDFNPYKNLKLTIYDENINCLDSKSLTLLFNSENDKIIRQIRSYGENINIDYTDNYTRYEYPLILKSCYTKTLKINKNNLKMTTTLSIFRNDVPVTEEEFNKTVKKTVDYDNDTFDYNNSFKDCKKLVKALK